MPKQTAIACTVPYGSGGLGQHFAQVVDEACDRGDQVRCYTPRGKAGDDASTVVIEDRFGRCLTRYTPMRFNPGAINHFENTRFSRAVAKKLRSPLDTMVSFGGQALHAFRRARALGARRLVLLAANSHVNNVARLHADAVAACPVEKSWLNARQVRQTLAEYELADTILIASQYSWETFVREGVREEKLQRVHYAPAARFKPPAHRRIDGIFRVLYIGSVTAMKGVLLLLEAFSRVADPRAELTLLGGTATRGMRKYMAQCLRRDARIRMLWDDPLPHLHRASVLVHPTYEDNLPYAGIEAMACGVPVIFTADTGTKEYVREGVNGFVVPTGSSQGILEKLEHLRREPMTIADPLVISDREAVGVAS